MAVEAQLNGHQSRKRFQLPVRFRFSTDLLPDLSLSVTMLNPKGRRRTKSSDLLRGTFHEIQSLLERSWHKFAAANVVWDKDWQRGQPFRAWTTRLTELTRALTGSKKMRSIVLRRRGRFGLEAA